MERSSCPSPAQTNLDFGRRLSGAGTCWTTAFQKPVGCDSFNIDVPLEGETTWGLLFAKRVRFPYDDYSPVAQPSTPEEREYRITGVIADNEIGQPSDIATAVVPG